MLARYSHAARAALAIVTVSTGLTVLSLPISAPARADADGLSVGVASTLSGSGANATSAGTGTDASLARPSGAVAVGDAVFVGTNDAIAQVSTATGGTSILSGAAGSPGCTDAATGVASRHGQVKSVSSDGTSLYSMEGCDWNTGQVDVRKTTIATGATSIIAGPLSANSMTYAADGYLYLTMSNTVVRMNASTGASTTVATFPNGSNGTASHGEGIATDTTTIFTFAEVLVGNTWIHRLFTLPLSGGGLSQLGTDDPNSFGRGLTSAGSYLFATADSGTVLRRYAKSDGSWTNVAGQSFAGYANGTGTDASFNSIYAITYDGTNIYIADYTNNRLRQVSPSTALPTTQPTSANTASPIKLGRAITIAGNGTNTDAPGIGSDASLASPAAVAVEGDDAYLATKNVIMKEDLTTNAVTVFSGTANQGSGCQDGLSGNSSLHAGVKAMASDGHYLYTLESCGLIANSNYVRRTSLASGGTSTVTQLTPAGRGLAVAPNGSLFVTRGTDLDELDPINQTVTRLYTFPAGASAPSPIAVAADASHAYVAVETQMCCQGRATYWRDQIISYAIDSGTVSTLGSSDNFDIYPLALVSAGDYVYSTAYGGSGLRRWSKTDGSSVDVAGTSTSGYTDGIGAAARFSGLITGLTDDGKNLYVADQGNQRVRMVVPVPAAVANGGPLWPGETRFGGCSCAEHLDGRQHVGDPVDTATGALNESVTDLTLPGRGIQATVRRAYDSQAAAALGRFGYGWTDNYATSVIVDPTQGVAPLATSPIVDVVQDSGSLLPFTRQTDGSYSAPTRVLATLVRNGDGTWTFVRRSRQTFAFDSSGRLTRISDLNAYNTMLTYNGSGQLTTVTDPAGRSLTYSYGANGLVSSISDTAGRTVGYGYDTAKNLTSVTEPTGSVTGYGYDANHRLTTLTDPRSHTVQNVYDAAARVISQTDRKNRTTTFRYGIPRGDGSATTTITDPMGNITQQVYADGLLTRQTKAVGTSLEATWTYTYDPTTNGLASITDPLNHTTSYTYDSAGDQLTATDPLNHTETRTYDGLGDPLTAQDRNGVTTTNTYDSDGNLLSTSTPLAGTTGHRVTSYTYGDTTHPGDVTAVTDPRNKTTEFDYDSYGQLTASTDPRGKTTTYAYTCTPVGAGCRSNVGWVYAMVPPRGNVTGADPADFTTSYTRDDDGRILSITDPLGHGTSTTYDANGNVASVTDPNNHTTSYAYDSDDELTVTTRPDTTTLGTGYDDDGNVTSHTDGANQVTSYHYNALNQLESTATPPTTSNPAGITTNYTYDPVGRLATKTAPGGLITTYDYDAASRLTGIDYSDSGTPDVTYGYDDAGQRTSMADGSGTTSYSYDSLGRLTTSTDGDNHTIGYDYDLAGNVTAITYPNGHTVTRDYDDNGRFTGLTDWSSNTTSFDYDDDGNLTGIDYPNGVTETRTVDSANRLTGITDTSGTVSLADYTYTRSPAGQLNTAAETNAASTTTNYGYDHTPLDQLSTSTANGSGGDYGYDTADNLTDFSDGASQTFDTANEITGHTAADAAVTDYAYNGRGDRTTAITGSDTASYGYDQADRLTTYTAPDTTITDYTYNGDGLRTTKTGGSIGDYTWDTVTGGVPVMLSDGDTSYLYGPGDLPVEQLDGSDAPTYLHHDQQDSTRLLTDDTGAIIGSYTYDPYGNVTSHIGVNTPLRYNGQYRDSETGNYYLRARYYDPQTAQFLTRDLLEALTGAPYGYADGDPLDQSDPLGLASCGPFAALCSAASTVSNGIQDGIRATEDVVAVPVYFTYYGSYYAAKGINSVGSHFGAPGRVVSHAVALPFAAAQAVGLGGDIVIDKLKGEDWADESRSECDKRPINPLHSFGSLPGFLRAGPKLYLPGAYRDDQGNAHVNWEW